LAEHCRHARFVWNLAVEQQQHWQPGRQAPGYHEQCAQLTTARAEYDWLAAGSQTVQQLGVPPACGGACLYTNTPVRLAFCARSRPKD